MKLMSLIEHSDKKQLIFPADYDIWCSLVDSLVDLTSMSDLIYDDSLVLFKLSWRFGYVFTDTDGTRIMPLGFDGQVIQPTGAITKLNRCPLAIYKYELSRDDYNLIPSATSKKIMRAHQDKVLEMYHNMLYDIRKHASPRKANAKNDLASLRSLVARVFALHIHDLLDIQ